jgi:formylglycine-generating enzyme required for sulfatase activity
VTRRATNQGSLSQGALTTSASGEREAARREELTKIIADVAARRARGENLPDSVVLAQRPDLRPDLQDELAALRDIHRTFLAAQKAGQATVLFPFGSDSLAVDAPVTAGESSQELPSETIPGYTVVSETSSGGQGAVFRARQEITGKTVAIKVIWGGALTGSRHRARFEREAEIMARLDHPSIVPILDRGRTADGSLFLVMPFIEGCPLDEYIDQLRSKPDPDLTQVLDIFVQICNAVAEAHKQGIIHRDLKPTNVRVDLRGRPHVLDFGLALPQPGSQIDHVQSVTMTGQIVGSLPWASPEQVSPGTRPMDTRSDVYSLGVMLYQALTGVFPYPIAGSVQEVLNNILTAKPVAPGRFPGRFARRIRPGLSAIVLRALSKDPKGRYLTAAELAEDLSRYLAGRRLDPATVPARPIRWRRYAGMAFVVVAAIGIGLLMAWREGRPNVPGNLTLPRITNGIGMQLARIPPGGFMMGSLVGEPGRGIDEPMHEVTIEGPFLLGVTEVTQREYRLVMGSLPPGQVVEGDQIPVHNLSHDDAVAFCRELSRREGVTYRLPTEEEWEYACRAGANGAAYARPGVLEDLGWYKRNSDGRPHPVEGLMPNPWGLFDMHGGVSEWNNDPYRPFPASSPGNRVASGSNDRYVLRGGSFLQPAQRCRAAAREWRQGGERVVDAGLRVVCDESQEP